MDLSKTFNFKTKLRQCSTETMENENHIQLRNINGKENKRVREREIMVIQGHEQRERGD